MELSFRVDCKFRVKVSNFLRRKASAQNQCCMDTLTVFQELAHYNRIANRRLYESCAQIGDDEYRRQRAGSFGSIHALLNHGLLADRIWMSRFSGGGKTTPPLNTVLHNEFAALRTAREQDDIALEQFFQNAPVSFLTQKQQRSALRRGGCSSCAAHVQSSNTPSRTGPRHAEPVRRTAAVAGYAPDSESLGNHANMNPRIAAKAVERKFTPLFRKTPFLSSVAPSRLSTSVPNIAAATQESRA